VSKKTGKPIKPRKPEKNNRKNRTEKKPIKFLKKRVGSVRFGFGFISKKPKKPNRTETDKKLEKNRAKTGKNRANTGKTEPNRFEPVFALKKPNRNRSV